MNALVIGALVALGMPQQTDTVFPAQGARMMEVTAPAGSIVVTGWDRDEIRIKADHSSRTWVEIRRSGTRVSVAASARRGPATIVDYEISVPRAMALELGGMSADILVEGVDGGVEARVTQGDVTVRGRGKAEVSSTTGKVTVEGAQGVDAQSTADEVRLVNVGGAVAAESAGGNIVILGSTATSVDAGTVGGRVHYEGAYQRGGTYFFGTHGGTVTLVVPEGASATFRLATVYGTVVNGLEATLERSEGGQRHTIEVGGGGALVEAETFAGRISLVRAGSPGARPPAPRSGGREAGT